VLEAFIGKYADTLYGPIARARLEQVKTSRLAVAPPPPPSRQPAPVTPATLPSSADNRYGAIAYSAATGAHGWAHDYGSKDTAEAAAIANCRLQANDCSVPVSFRNGCGALAVGSTNFGSGWGADRKTAERFALRLCGQRSRNCRIVRQVCTTP
jgi:serine/threonine-protein kinase